MIKNVCKIRVLMWLVLLLFVFSCENDAEKERIRVEREIEVEDSIRGYRLVDVDIPKNKRERDSLYRHFDSTKAVRDSFWKDKEFDIPSSTDFETVFNFCRINFPGTDGCTNEIRMRILEKEGIQVKRKGAGAKWLHSDSIAEFEIDSIAKRLIETGISPEMAQDMEKVMKNAKELEKRKKIDSLHSLRKDPFYSPKITISDEDMKKILRNVKFDGEDSLSK